MRIFREQQIDAGKFLEFSVFLSARMSYLKQCGHLFGELQGEGAGLIPVPVCSVNSFFCLSFVINDHAEDVASAL